MRYFSVKEVVVGSNPINTFGYCSSVGRALKSLSLIISFSMGPWYKGITSVLQTEDAVSIPLVPPFERLRYENSYSVSLYVAQVVMILF